MLCIAPVFFTLLLENNWSGYVLAIVCVFAAQLIARIMVNSRTPSRLVNRSVNDHQHSLLGSGAAGRKFDPVYSSTVCQPPLAGMTVPHRIVPVGQCDCGDGGGRGAGVAEQRNARSVLRDLA